MGKTKLVASLSTHNELHRYLPGVLDNLLSFCDQVAVFDDGSTDGTAEYLRHRVAFEDGKLVVHMNEDPIWPHSQSQLRQAQLDMAMSLRPTHILSIDADEFVVGGKLVKDFLEFDTWPNQVACYEYEIWQTTKGQYHYRKDGQWDPKLLPLVFRVRDYMNEDGRLYVGDQKFDGAKHPASVNDDFNVNSLNLQDVAAILHFGWNKKSERKARMDRHLEQDTGDQHDPEHVASIGDDEFELKVFPEENPRFLLVKSDPVWETLKKMYERGELVEHED